MNMKRIYVTVGNPCGEIPIMPFVAMDVEEPHVVKAAKNFRKQVADNPEGYGYVKGTKFSPSQLYWAIYDHVSEDAKPFAASDNFFWKETLLKEAQKIEDEKWAELQKASEIHFQDFLDEQETHKKPEDAICPNCLCYGLYDGHCQACEQDICPNCQEVLDESMQCDSCGYGL